MNLGCWDLGGLLFKNSNPCEAQSSSISKSIFVFGSIPGRVEGGCWTSTLSSSSCSACTSTKLSSIWMASLSTWPLKVTRGFLINQYHLNSVATSPATETNVHQDFNKILMCTFISITDLNNKVYYSIFPNLLRLDFLTFSWMFFPFSFSSSTFPFFPFLLFNKFQMLFITTPVLENVW